MNDWVEDAWVGFACDMAEEFFRKHEETMPEDPHRVWDENEIGYFSFAFTLWAAKSKFQLKKGTAFDARASSYRAYVQALVKGLQQVKVGDCESANFDAYLLRESEYVRLLMKGSSSIFRVLTVSTFKPACKSFIAHSCKRYIFSQSDLVKVICPWLVEKGMDFDRQIDFE